MGQIPRFTERISSLPWNHFGDNSTGVQLTYEYRKQYNAELLSTKQLQVIAYFISKSQKFWGPIFKTS